MFYLVWTGRGGHRSPASQTRKQAVAALSPPTLRADFHGVTETSYQRRFLTEWDKPFYFVNLVRWTELHVHVKLVWSWRKVVKKISKKLPHGPRFHTEPSGVALGCYGNANALDWSSCKFLGRAPDAALSSMSDAVLVPGYWQRHREVQTLTLPRTQALIRHRMYDLQIFECSEDLSRPWIRSFELHSNFKRTRCMEHRLSTSTRHVFSSWRPFYWSVYPLFLTSAPAMHSSLQQYSKDF